MRTVASATPVSAGRVDDQRTQLQRGGGRGGGYRRNHANPAAVRLTDRFELNGDTSRNGLHWRLYAPPEQPAIAPLRATGSESLFSFWSSLGGPGDKALSLGARVPATAARIAGMRLSYGLLILVPGGYCSAHVDGPRTR